MKRFLRPALTSVLALLLAACSGNAEYRRSYKHGRAPSEPGQQYVVQRGDTLFSIAFRKQLDFHQLAEWNGIGRGYVIYPGRVLRLSPPGSESAPAPRPVDAEAAPPYAVEQQPQGPVAIPPLPPDSAPPPPMAAVSSDSVAADFHGPGFDPGRWEWPTRGKPARVFSGDGSSKGIDIAGDVGQIVVAAAGGKVVYSGSALKGYGELVIIKHDDQYLSAYGYNRRRLVEEGQQVVAGQPIAELGLGPEQRPLLHFEIRDRGRPIDPLPLLPKRQ